MPHPIRGYSYSQMLRPGWSEYGGWRVHGTHAGFDYYCPEGTPIYATGNGFVSGKGGPTGDAGWQVTIDYGSYVTRNVHMRGASPLGIGARVNSATVVGYVGASGNAANIIWNGKRHLHHEVYVNGSRRDPIAFYGPVPDPGFAGGGSQPIPIPPKKESRSMYLFRTTDGSMGLMTDSGYAGIGSPAHVQLFLRMFNAYPDSETFLAAERDIMIAYIHAAATADDAKRQEILNAVNAINVPSAQEIADAVVAALPPSQGGTGPSAQDIALAVEQQLADNFALIPQAVNLDLKNRL